MGTKESLGYYWTAKFSDNSEISQFDGNGDEVRFAEVLNNPLDLKEFRLQSSEEDEEYLMDINDMRIHTPTRNYVVTGANPELIYFRRNQVRMEMSGPNMKELLVPRVVHKST